MISVCLTDTLKGCYSLPTSWRLRKLESNGGILFLRWIDSFHLFKQFDSCLSLRGFGCFGTETTDKILMVSDFTLLISVGGKVLFFPLFFLNQEIIKVTAVAMNLTVTNLQDACTNSIEKGTVMRNG